VLVINGLMIKLVTVFVDGFIVHGLISAIPILIERNSAARLGP